jgi:hypothetical protein
LLVSNCQHAFDKIAVSQNAFITLVKDFGFPKGFDFQPTAGGKGDVGERLKVGYL